MVSSGILMPTKAELKYFLKTNLNKKDIK